MEDCSASRRWCSSKGTGGGGWAACFSLPFPLPLDGFAAAVFAAGEGVGFAAAGEGVGDAGGASEAAVPARVPPLPGLGVPGFDDVGLGIYG